MFEGKVDTSVEQRLRVRPLQMVHYKQESKRTKNKDEEKEARKEKRETQSKNEEKQSRKIEWTNSENLDVKPAKSASPLTQKEENSTGNPDYR